MDASVERSSGEIVVASFPPDNFGKAMFHAVGAAIAGEAALVVCEGPCGLPWENIEGEFRQRDWNVTVDEFLTTEFGEMAVRRRKCLVASPDIRVDGTLATTTSRSTLAPPIGATLGHNREMCKDVWVFPEQVVMDSGIPKNPLMPILERWELFGDSPRRRCGHARAGPRSSGIVW